jgi:hypothetical protein
MQHPCVVVSLPRHIAVAAVVAGGAVAAAAGGGAVAAAAAGVAAAAADNAGAAVAAGAPRAPARRRCCRRPATASSKSLLLLLLLHQRLSSKSALHQRCSGTARCLRARQYLHKTTTSKASKVGATRARARCTRDAAERRAAFAPPPVRPSVFALDYYE